MVPPQTPPPGGSFINLAAYLKAVVDYLETLASPTETPFRFGKMLTTGQWDQVRSYASTHYGGGPGTYGLAFANIFTSNHFTNASPAGTVGPNAEMDILAHGVLGTTLSSPSVDIDCRLQSIVIAASPNFDSIQMLCQPNYQGGWTTEILYYGNPIFYDAHGRVCSVNASSAPDCLFCNAVQPSIEVGCPNT